jgi:pimeloyl-ACP methyl ester carboxylesterase
MRNAVLLLACFGFPYLELPAQQRPAGPMPGTLVDIGGYRLHVFCSGPAMPGAPTVLLDAGAGQYSSAWSKVQSSLPGIRSCAYDRAGWGWSDPGPGPRTVTQEAFELERLLRAAHITAPYVLVGHSYAGLLVRRYAALHPGDVVGMVLVDPVDEDGRLFYVKQNAWLRVRDQSRARVIPRPRTLAQGDSTMSYYDPERDYWSEEFQSFYEARAANPQILGDRSIVILAAGKDEPPPGMSPEMWSEYRAERLSHLQGLTALSSRALFVRDSTSGHDMPKDDPRLIATCIAEVVAAATGPTTITRPARCVAPDRPR